MSPPASRPGLAKTRNAPLFASRTLSLFASSDARWAELFEKADMVSEGAPRASGDERTYYGCTDIVFLLTTERQGQDHSTLVAAVAKDPHVRVRALRVARREAAQRAEGPVGRMLAEITVASSSGGVTVHVEVEARVFPDRRAAPRAGGESGACAEADLFGDA